MTTMLRKLAAEGLGTAFLLATVVGSGIMAAKLAGGNTAIALLGNTIPTGAILVVLISTLGPISGAHFNPLVSLASLLNRSMKSGEVAAYITVQIIGAILGVFAAHAMFDLPLLQASTTMRNGGAQWLAEIVASFGLLTVIFLSVRNAPQQVGMNVGLYITAAYWFTASTSFANPAVTLARSFSDTFAGIKPEDVLGFVLAQLMGAALALAVDRWVWSSR
ncbi:MAG TPA: MIP/aquaporin family protein [Aestuariivirga sp.]|nr:MIP/aquaporin family protein [Aestuariivirga sp.]